jgi:signal transduction histidine kinase
MLEKATTEDKHKVGRIVHETESCLLEEGQPLVKRIFTGVDNPVKTGLRVYEDKYGIPVTYDASTQKQIKQAKPDDLSVLWHELLSPLTVIKGYTGTLLELNHAITETQREQYLRGIESANNRIIRLLENLRDISRLEENDALILHSISLPDMLRKIASETQFQSNRHFIKIFPAIRLPLVKADPDKIEQVISNLLGNAIKYSPKGGDIEGEIRLVRNEAELRRAFEDAPPLRLPSLVVSITDNGVGIPEVELDRVFERFFRVNNNSTRGIPGAGLGLYICKIIIEAHGGHIWARNRLQRGCVFSFSLPLV